MKIVLGVMLAVISTATAFSQADHLKPGEIRFYSQFQTSNGTSRVLRGNVRIETSNVIIRADSVVYNAQTSDIRASGDVHIRLKH